MSELSAYELRHVVGHLRSADQAKDIHRLLSISDQKGANLWFSVKEGNGDRDGYAIDLQDGLSVAIQALSSSDGPDAPASLGAALRYVFCLATLNGFAGSMPAPILRELARRNVWTERAVFDYAKRTPDPARRIESLAGVFAFLGAADQEECYFRACKSVTELQTVSGNHEMLVVFENEALSRLGDAFLERERHDLVVRLCDECRTWNGWEALAPEVARLLKKIPNSAMTQARRCSEEWYARTRDLLNRASFLGLLSGRQHQECVSVAMRAVMSPDSVLYKCVALLKSLHRYVSLKEFHNALDAVYVRVSEDNTTKLRLQLLVQLLPFLNRQRQRTILREALPFVRQPIWALDEVMDLVARLCEVASLKQSVVEAIKEVRSEHVRAHLRIQTLRAQTPDERDNSVSEIFEGFARNLSSGDVWSDEEIIRSLTQLTPLLNPSRVPEILERAKGITDRKLRLQALAEVLPFVHARDVDDVISGEVDGLKSVDNPAVIERFCSAASRVASNALLEQLPNLLRVPRSQGWFLVGLAPITDDVRDPALYAWLLDAARGAPDHVRYWCLLSIAGHLRFELTASAFEIARKLSKPSYRLECCCLIAKSNNNQTLIQQLSRLVKAELHALEDPKERAESLIRMLNTEIPLPTDSLIEDALQSISRVTHLSTRAELAAAARAWALPTITNIKAELIEEAFGAVRDVVARDALAAVAPSLDRHLTREVLSRIRNCLGDDLRYEALPQLLSRMAALGDSGQALECAFELANETLQGECLGTIAPHLNESLLLKHLTAYRTIKNPYHRDRALSAICIRAARLGIGRSTHECASEIRDSVERGKAFCALALTASGVERNLMLDEALRSFEGSNEIMKGNLVRPLAELFVALSRTHLLNQFGRLLAIMLTESREELVPQAYGLASVFRVVGGEGAADQVLGSVREVAQWWP